MRRLEVEDDRLSVVSLHVEAAEHRVGAVQLADTVRVQRLRQLLSLLEETVQLLQSPQT